MISINQFIIDDFIDRCLPQRPPREVVLLDLGCGDRRYRPLYQPRVSRSVGADFDVRTTALDCRLDAHALPFKPGVFDIVLLSEVIEHLDHAEQALGEVARVLKPGAMLLLTWPMHLHLHEIPHDIARYTEFGMRAMLQRAGFEIMRLQRRGGVLGVLLLISSHLGLGLTELLARRRWLGVVFGPVHRLTIKAFNGLNRCYARRIGRTARFWPSRPGEGLHGVTGHFSIWTLGYCALCRKQADESGP